MANHETESAPVFKGLRVLDVGSFIAGPGAATILSDLGAEVIKVEPPHGDPWRGQFRRPGLPTPPTDFDYMWALAARNRQSLVLNLKRPEGQAALHKLVETADVFVTNMPLKVRDRLKIEHDRLLEINPRLIYASLTGYGETGPDMHRPGFDSTAWWSRSGFMTMLGPSAEAPPSRSLTGMGDHLTAACLFGAVATGLYRRERTGKGGVVQTSLLASGAWSNANLIQAALAGGRFDGIVPREQAANPLHNHYLCGDGKWVNLSLNLANTGRDWPMLAATLESPELAELRIGSMAQLGAQHVEIIRLMDAAFLRRPAAEWLERLEARRFAVERVPEIDEVVADPQFRDAGIFVPTSYPDVLAETVMAPINVVGSSRRTPGPAPELGQHSEEILSGLGYSSEEIRQITAGD